MAKKYLDDSGQFSAVSAGTTYTLPAATAAALGGVKLAAKIAPIAAGSDATGTATNVLKGINDVITALQNAGIMAK